MTRYLFCIALLLAAPALAVAMEAFMMRDPTIIAHRGARAHAPENTLAAARLGHAQGAAMWELDTGLTKDGHLIVIHDDSLERTTDVAMRPEFAARTPWNIKDFTLAEIRSLDAGSWFAKTDPFKTVAAGEVSSDRLAAYAGEKIPTLEEALLLTKELDWRVNVEIKNHAGRPGHERITRQVTDLIRNLGMMDRVLLSSFQHQYLREAAELMPELPRGALIEEVRPENAVNICLAAKAAFYHPRHNLVTTDDMAALKTAGIAVNVWTVNDIEDMQQARARGVAGIITDYPGRLREMLHTPSPRTGGPLQ